MDIDLSIDRLACALERANVSPAPAGDSLALVDEVAASISPLRLPAELVRFYERVDSGALGILPYPSCAGLEFALRTWLQHRDGQAGLVPEALFPLCYESWSFLFVELDGPHRSGDRLFDWSYGGSDFRLRFAWLGDWLDVLTEVIETGAWTPIDTTTSGQVAIRPDRDVYEQLAAAALGPDVVLVAEDAGSWPPHWHVKSADPDAAPRGSTHTISELRASMAVGRVSGIIAGAVSRVAVADAGERLIVVDGTGMLDLWCPKSIARYAVLGVADYLEFEVTAGIPPDEWQPPSRPEGTSHLESVAPNPRRGTFVDWLHRTPPEAVVSALRRVDRPDREA